MLAQLMCNAITASLMAHKVIVRETLYEVGRNCFSRGLGEDATPQFIAVLHLNPNA